MDQELSSANTIAIGHVRTSIGAFGVALTAGGIGRLAFPSEPLEACERWARKRLPDARIIREKKFLRPVADELAAYFEGALRDFSVPVDLRGTPFQLLVWRAVQRVPFGHTQTYAHIASALGDAKAVRAVGAANGANPVPIIVPCHRIIGSDGKLVGYGGGLDMKARLLQLEGVMM